MAHSQTATLISPIREAVYPLEGRSTDYDPLMDVVGDARLVLLGEASHGTHEFYRERAEITKRLITQKGFTAVAVEADWPAAYRVNCYVRHAGQDSTGTDALGDFQRFPAWMWRNIEVRDFIGWLRDHNGIISPGGQPVGFYGLDLYSLYSSIEAVVTYLDEVDPEAAERARARYSCFEHMNRDAQAYGLATAMGEMEPCEDQVVEQLIDLQRHASDLAGRNGSVAEDELFFAEQNARVVKNAEQYYRSMFRGGVVSWNLRDRHMAGTLDALVNHLDIQSGDGKIVVWAHNSHLGDARATERAQVGELNLGQLARENYGSDAVLVGFSTYYGTVTAASDWGGVAEHKQVKPALPGSYEALLHEANIPQILLPLRGETPATDTLRNARLQRAIGVIYRPESERHSHYYYATLPEQYDALLHFDETRAVEPLERTSEWDEEPPETYPFTE